VLCRELDNNELSGILEDSAGTFSALTSLTQLSLSSNKIKSITKRAFDGLGSLEQLFLLDNNITSVQDNAFACLKILQEM
jgi:Leucine-rich repeat (LRR) protein